MLKQTFIFFIYLIIGFSSFSQSERGKVKADSLLRLIPKTENQKELSDIYNQLGRELRDSGNKDSSLLFAKKALKLAEKEHYIDGQINAHLNLGQSYREFNDFSKSVEHLNKLLKLSEIQNNQHKKGDAYDNLGHVCLQMGDTLTALKHHLTSLEIRKKVNDIHGQGNSHENIAHIYSSLKNFKSALEHFEGALSNFEKIKDTFRIALSSANAGYMNYYIGQHYEALTRFTTARRHYILLKNKEGEEWMEQMIAHLYSDLGHYDKALAHYRKVLHKAKAENNEIEVMSAYELIGRTCMLKEEYSKALFYVRKSLEMAIKNQLPKGIMSSNFYMGDIYYRQQQYNEAMDYFLTAHQLSIEIKEVYWIAVTKERIGRSFFYLGKINESKKWITDAQEMSQQIFILQDISDNYLILSKIDSIQGNYQSAYMNHQLYVKYKEALQTDNAKKLAMQLDFEEKDKKTEQAKLLAEKELRNKKLQRNAATGGLLLMSLLTVSILYLFRLRNKKIKAEQQNLELKQKEIELVKETEQFKSRFLTNISHEFRTPLTLINGNIGLLKKQSKPDDLEKLEEINRNGERLLQLVNQLLDLSKIESGHYVLSYSDGNLLNEVLAYISTFNSYAAGKNLQFITRMTDKADKTLSGKLFSYSSEAIQTIITNLLSNAIKFSADGGAVSVEVDFDTDILTLSISDSGPGIPDEHFPQIFDRFYQVEKAYNATQKGSGIGLALVKELACLHHGDVTVSNTPEGGCTFKVWIICKESKINKLTDSTSDNETRQVESLHTIANPTETGEDVPLILIAEDQPELRKFIVENIGTGFNCIEAENGKTGYEAAQRHVPDLIISDVMMPEMDGVELCKAVKENKITSHIPVILLTAKADTSDRITGLEAGADDYILKPFSTEELRLRIRNSIRSQQLLRNKLKDGQIPDKGELSQLSSYDRDFLLGLKSTIEKNIPNPRFTVAELADSAYLSQSQLTRKMKAITGNTPSDLIRKMRFEKALRLLKENKSVADVCWSVGFEDPAYFGKAFKKHFGVAPSEYKTINN